MKYKVLIITNNLSSKIQIEDDLKKFKEYISSKTPLELEYHFEETDLELKHKSFRVRSMLKGEYKDMYGLDGIKDQIRELNIVHPYTYHAAIFLYDLNKTEFEDNYSVENLGHWTYFNQLVSGTEFVEIATTHGWDKVNDIFRVLTHEIFHVWHFRLKRQKILTKDTMDKYDGEFDVYDEDGNRERNLLEVYPYWSKITYMPNPDNIINSLNNIIKLLQERISQLSKKTEPNKKKLERWAESIREFEGWYVGSRSYRNNNPGNLRYSKYQIGLDDGNYSIFKDYDDGWKALLFQLQIAIDGRSRHYRPTMTLLEFFKVYAPSSDNNHPLVYAEFIAAKLGTTINTKLEDIF